MNTAGPFVSYRRYWLPELIVLTALAFLAFFLFAFTKLDIAATRLFFRPESADFWPIANEPLWSLFYRATPWITGSLAVTGVIMMVTGLVREDSKRLRLYGLFILLCVALGPGLIINAVFKDHWGRPRPRQIIEFNGKFDYVRPLVPSHSGGKSFPCGDSSVGFLMSAGWWLWRRSHPKRAAASLTAGLTFGTLLGIGRMVAGAHFLSDVVWSALIVYGVAHTLYYYILRIPAREDSRAVMYPLIESSPRLRMAVIAASCLLGVGIISGGLFANPSNKDLSARIPYDGYPAVPEQVEVIVDTLDVDIELVAQPESEILCSGNVHGFGLPTNEIKSIWEFEEQPLPTLRYRVVEKGVFTDIDGVAHLKIPVTNLRTIIVRVKRGDITIKSAANVPRHRPSTDLITLDGKVQQR
ncbi:MAG TPA: phosphatase PAP2 family protein [Nitrospirota bacterium]|nr:phosphatase PAP2 family protein [Nitrospirota bacterium]